MSSGGSDDASVLRDPADFPALYQSTDQSSLDGQKRFLWATKVRLVGLTLAAVCGAFDVTAGRVNPAGLAAVTCFAVALAAELYLLVTKPDRVWYEGRAAAESVKTMTWRYAVHGNPFGDDVVDADEKFLHQVSDILHDLGELYFDPSIRADQQITAAMQKLRGEGFNVRKQAYTDGRIEDQRDWYARKSQWNRTRSSRWAFGAIAMELAGFAMGWLRGFGVVHIDLLGIFAAVAAGVTAWSQAKQYDTLHQAYFVASQELAAIRSEVEKQPPEQWASFVDQAEGAISREHTLWRAARGVGSGRQ